MPYIYCERKIDTFHIFFDFQAEGKLYQLNVWSEKSCFDLSQCKEFVLESEIKAENKHTETQNCLTYAEEKVSSAWTQFQSYIRERTSELLKLMRHTPECMNSLSIDFWVPQMQCIYKVSKYNKNQ